MPKWMRFELRRGTSGWRFGRMERFNWVRWLEVSDSEALVPGVDKFLVRERRRGRPDQGVNPRPLPQYDRPLWRYALMVPPFRSRSLEQSPTSSLPRRQLARSDQTPTRFRLWPRSLHPSRPV